MVADRNILSLPCVPIMMLTLVMPALVSAAPPVTWSMQPDVSSPTLGFTVPQQATYQLLYRADGTAVGDCGAYNHHPQIIFHAGKLFVTWSNHLKDEDAAGQRIYFRYSSDLGVTWVPPVDQKPSEIFPSMDHWKFASDPARETDRTCTADGFVEIDGTLYALNEVLPSIQLQNKGVGRMARRINDDGTFGQPFWLKQHAPAAPAGFPLYADLSNPTFTTIGSTIMAKLTDPDRADLPTWDFNGERNTSTELCFPPALPADGHHLCEPTHSIELTDGSRLMFWRDLGVAGKASHKLYMCSKPAHGDWSTPNQTEFPDAGSKSYAGQLLDGRYFVISNPNSAAGRTVLTISLSTNGFTFDRCYCIRGQKTKPRFAGRYKGSGFAYPSACCTQDSLYAIYSVNKEDIELVRIPLTSLSQRLP